MERIDWHTRFTQQAHWTRDLRVYLFGCAGLEHASRVLEVGCGTAAVLDGLPTRAALHGLDLDQARLSEASIHVPAAFLTCGDALCLPYPDAAFDLVFCHFLLLWVSDPLQALLEMRRVTRPGGDVLALAEPDYSARQDAPPVLEQLGQLQNESLQQQGADIALGSRLGELFAQAGMQPIECGTLTPSPSEPPPPGERDLEWEVLEADLTGFVPAEVVQSYRLLHLAAQQKGERILHVPTWFAWAQA